MLRWLSIGILLMCAVARGDVARAPDGATARHLLAGVRAFHAGRYEDALVELRVVARAPDAPADLAFYLGPTLVQLGRDREALAVFLASSARPDALTEIYLGEAYYHLRLYRKARAVFAGLRTRGLGPALDPIAARYVAQVDAVYATPPTGAALTATLDYYIDGAAEAQLQAPDTPGDVVVRATLYGVESRPLTITFAPGPAVGSFPVGVQVNTREGVLTLTAGPLLGPLGQFVPDGTPVQFRLSAPDGGERLLEAKAERGCAVAELRLAGLPSGAYQAEVLVGSGRGTTAFQVP